MEMPAIFVRYDDGLKAMKVEDGACTPSGPAIPFQDALPSLPASDSRGTVAVIDWDGVTHKRFNENVVKNIRIRGSDIWLMTCVRNVEDLMDAFNTTAEMVLAPTHLMSDGGAEDIQSVSDSVIPTVFARPKMDIFKELDALESIGYLKFCVYDSKSCIYDWERVLDSFPTAIPFCSNAVGPGDSIIPLRFRA